MDQKQPPRLSNS